MAENIHRPMWSRTYAMISPVAARTCSRVFLMVYSRWTSDVGMKTWTISTSQSMHASTSAGSDRARPHTCAERPRPLMALTISCSAAEDAGKPASMVWTPMFERCSAIPNFSSRVNEMPGVCSPSRSVVSKTVTFFFARLSVKKTVRFSVPGCFSVCRVHTYSLSEVVYIARAPDRATSRGFYEIFNNNPRQHC